MPDMLQNDAHLHIFLATLGQRIFDHLVEIISAF
jgi:hypothetical protein